MEPSSIVGIDPRLIDSSSFASLSSYLSASDITLKSIQKNLVDEVWDDRPAITYGEIVPLPHKYSGRRIHEKLADVRKEMKTLGVQSHIVLALDDIACKIYSLTIFCLITYNSNI